jgi:hypothetical protein
MVELLSSVFSARCFSRNDAKRSNGLITPKFPLDSIGCRSNGQPEVVANFEKVEISTGDSSGTKINQMSMAAALPLATWSTCAECVRIVWQMRWAPTGMMPVRPVLVLLSPATIPSGHALKLWAEAE